MSMQLRLILLRHCLIVLKACVLSSNQYHTVSSNEYEDKDEDDAMERRKEYGGFGCCQY
jgi:hypothetical protein